jgi:hypothetical protein
MIIDNHNGGKHNNKTSRAYKILVISIINTITIITLISIG